MRPDQAQMNTEAQQTRNWQSRRMAYDEREGLGRHRSHVVGLVV
jgi:hypothetical protein